MGFLKNQTHKKIRINTVLFLRSYLVVVVVEVVAGVLKIQYLQHAIPPSVFTYTLLVVVELLKKQRHII